VSPPVDCFNCLRTKRRPFGDEAVRPETYPRGTHDRNRRKRQQQRGCHSVTISCDPSGIVTSLPRPPQEAGQLSARGRNGRELSIRALDETIVRGGARLSVRVIAQALGAHPSDRLLWSTEHSGIKRRIESSDLSRLRLVLVLVLAVAGAGVSCAHAS
jgi:hypothetical protein